jgi:hypothetical protein
MARVTRRDIDTLWGPATPQFALQIADRLRDLISPLDPNDPIRRYGEEKLAALARLGHDTTKGPEHHPGSH